MTLSVHYQVQPTVGFLVTRSFEDTQTIHVNEPTGVKE